MSDEQTDGDKRPNSNYQLSNSNNESSSGSEIIYHYSRERRLAKAPQSVRDIYNDEPVKPRFGLLGPLIADKPRRILFFMILFLCALIFLLSTLGFFDDTYSLDGNKLVISGITVEDSTIVIIRKKDGNADSYTGALNIAVSIPVKKADDISLEAQSVFYHRVYLSLESNEEFRLLVPFNAPELLMVLQTEKSALQLTFKPE